MAHCLEYCPGAVEEAERVSRGGARVLLNPLVVITRSNTQGLAELC